MINCSDFFIMISEFTNAASSSLNIRASDLYGKLLVQFVLACSYPKKNTRQCLSYLVFSER